MASAADKFFNGVRKYFLLTVLFLIFALPGDSAETMIRMGKGVHIDFSTAKTTPNGRLIGDWHYRKKPFTKGAVFSLARDEKGKKILRAESRNGSASILYNVSHVDMKKYPILRWKWKVVRIPRGASATDPKKDDQALGLYVGAGVTTTDSVAFRWETETPKGASGEAKYNFGLVSVRWFSMRDKRDRLNTWYVEEVNIYEHLNDFFKGDIPKGIAMSISCNSQYTKSHTLGFIEYIEFLPLSEKGKITVEQ